jgi:PEGA domain-containing protein
MRPLSLVFAFLFLAAGVAAAQQKPRVFITDSKSWEMRGAGGGSSEGFGGASSGGARPQTAEIIKTFGERCPDVMVNNKQEKADYVVLLDHEGGKSILVKDNKVAVFNRDGDTIVSHSTRSLGGSVDDACKAIMKDWAEGGTARSAAAAADPKPDPAPAAAPATPAKVDVSSTPDGADIEVDGSFVGNTPSAIELAPGDHEVRVSKSGYQAWERKIKVTGGDVHLKAELEPAK